MADLKKLETALINAHAAGDEEGARILAQEIKRMRGNEGAAARMISGTPEIDPTEGMSTTQKVLAGVGMGMTNAARGVGNLVGLVSDEEIAEAKRLDAPLANTTAGTVGNVLGSAAALAPVALMPGANTIAGAGLYGAGTGFLTTPGNMAERGQAAFMGGVGGILGQSLPAAYRTVKASVEPLTKKGQDKILARVLREAAGDNADVVASRLKGAAPLIPGSSPTAAEVAESGGIAALQRAMSAADPEAYTHRAMEQASARMSALRQIAKDPAAREAQEKVVNQTAKRLYGEAFKESVPVTDDLVKLVSRPSMRAAEKRADKLASELSAPFRATLDDMRPKYAQVDPAKDSASVLYEGPTKLLEVPTPERFSNVSSVVPDEAMGGVGVTRQVDDVINVGRGPQRYFEAPGDILEKQFSFSERPASYMEIPPVDSVPVRDMHTVKMGMDAMLSDPTLGIAGREANAIKATRERLLDMLPESYQTARRAHIELNKPIHQMDIASEMIKRVSPAINDVGGLTRESAAKYAQALREMDDVAKNVTGLKNAKMRDIMTPEQMDTLVAVAQDLARKSNAQDLGRGVGSNTFQNFAMNNLAQSNGMPSAVGGLFNLVPMASRTAGAVTSAGKALGNVIYRSKDEAMRSRMAQALLNPQETAGLMELALTQPGRVAQLLRNPTVQALPGVAGMALPAAQ